MQTYHLSIRSTNRKTGPIPVSTTSPDSCPPSCPLLGKACYAKQGKLSIHWRNLPERYGVSFSEFLRRIRSLPPGQRWRHNQAGDLPGDGERISRPKLLALCRSAAHTKGFTYTHKNPSIPGNREAIAEADAMPGLTINLSADGLEEADRLVEMEVAPVVTLLPRSAGKVTYTPKGRRVVTCPAQTTDGVTCETCGGKNGPLCHIKNRDFIVGFRAHGVQAKAAEVVFRENTLPKWEEKDEGDL